MSRFARITRVIAFLRSEIPVEDISARPIVEHPHNTSRTIPQRLPAAKIKELSVLEPARALAATAGEWVSIAAAIVLCSYFWHPALYLIAVMFIGAFRKFHGTHHQYIGLPSDGNRHIWYTHDAAGELEPDWVFPKTRLGLALVLLRRAFFFTGMFWIIRALVGSSLIPSPTWMIAARLAFYASVTGALTFFGAWSAFLLYWLVPYCTWHILAQYVRLICEHSAVESDEEEYAITRTTIPTWLESIFILPCNVGYHIEHHWYPSVPFYRLPELHQHLMAREGFQRYAVVKRSVFASLGECIKLQLAEQMGSVHARQAQETVAREELAARAPSSTAQERLHQVI